ncbi:exodeoxyribonuclease III [Maribrevibacterium harenarium]|uniref:Exodeoxyribonuclease III n=1 Tax=Maribrevibacterium harenarium TaxID=2589817 RepID=A0A501WUB3_9GAMM|nr:exodeoxyribonuclease III [Maribrevibacterium harenarium]TPE52312.1 exodeoxyribonuclease III [Maribrevibacterium harenarium]
MKIVSFNINGLRARPHQLDAVKLSLDADVIGLQETKVHDDAFPLEVAQQYGYHAYYFGQKSHYGVALLSKLHAAKVEYGFPNDDSEAQRRVIMATFATEKGPLKVINGYFPQGESRDHPTKFPAKEKFYQDLQAYLTQHNDVEQVVIMGDFNISAEDCDIGIGDANAKRWLRTGKCSFLPEERAWFKALLDLGFTDSYRHIYPSNNDQFSWFDYRSKGFEDTPKRGLRIDGVLCSDNLVPFLSQAGISYEIRAMEKPSDHAPIWAELDI